MIAAPRTARAVISSAPVLAHPVVPAVPVDLVSLQVAHGPSILRAPLPAATLERAVPVAQEVQAHALASAHVPALVDRLALDSVVLDLVLEARRRPAKHHARNALLPRAAVAVSSIPRPKKAR